MSGKIGDLTAEELVDEFGPDLITGYGTELREELLRRLSAAGEHGSYGKGWHRVVVMVSDSGEVHSVGGYAAPNPNGGESEYPGFEILKRRLSAAPQAQGDDTPSRLQPAISMATRIVKGEICVHGTPLKHEAEGASSPRSQQIEKAAREIRETYIAANPKERREEIVAHIVEIISVALPGQPSPAPHPEND